MLLLLRRLVRRPIYAAVGTLTAALSLSAAGLAASIVHGLWLSPSTEYDVRNLVRIWEVVEGEEIPLPVSLVRVRAIARGAHSLEDVGFFGRTELTVRADGPLRLEAAVVTHNFFDVYGVRLLKGRDFTAEDVGSPVMLISERVWVQQFARSDSAIGRVLSIHGTPFAVLGIVPDGLAVPDPSVQIWLPLQTNRATAGDATLHEFQVVGRLLPGASVEQLRQDLSSLALSDVEGDEGHVIKAESLDRWLHGPARERAHWLILAAACMLLVAIANWTSLATARGLETVREMAIRESLGAPERTAFFHIAAEQVVLAGLAFPLALWIASMVSNILTHILADPQGSPLDLALLAPWPLLAMGLVAVGSSLLVALGSCRSPSGSLDRQLRAGRSVGRLHLTGASAIVAGEVAAAVVLASLTAHLLRRHAELSAVNPGFRVNGLALVSMTLAGTDYGSSREVETFYRRVQQQLIRHPAVSGVSGIDALPLGEDPGTDELLIEGMDSRLQRWEGITLHHVLGNYFRVSGTPLLEGRDFSVTERRDRPVAIVSESLARSVWGEGSPLGAKIKTARWRDEPWRTVVGVAADVRNLGLGQAPGFVVYEPHVQFPRRTMTLMVRTIPGRTLEPAALLRLVRSLDPSVPVEQPVTFAAKVRESIDVEQREARAATTVAVLVIMLTCAGIFAIVSFVLASRQREMAVRAALGAGPRTLMVHALAAALRPALSGAVLGVAVALALTVGFGAPEWRPRALETAVGSASLVLAVAVLAALRPALRSGRIAPAEALKEVSP